MRKTISADSPKGTFVGWALAALDCVAEVALAREYDLPGIVGLERKVEWTANHLAEALADFLEQRQQARRKRHAG